MFDFSSLKKSGFNKEALAEKLEKETSNTRYEDDRFWNCSKDKAGNGSAVIRFLPQPKGEEVPYVKYYRHAFKNDKTNKWYIENSLTSLNLPDPVSDLNSELWNTGTKENQDIARSRRRITTFVSNIYVVKDPENPENEGKVFLFRYGKKIFEKLKSAMKPQFEDDPKFNPFDLWEGANFKFRITKADNQVSYESSMFDAVGALSNNDEELEKIWNMEYSLQEFLDPSNYKTYDELKKRLDVVLNGAQKKAEHDEDEDIDLPSSTHVEEKVEKKPESRQEPVETKKEEVKEVKKSSPIDDDDDIPNYFNDLDD